SVWPMGTDKRERQKANRAARMAAEQAEAEKARRRRAIRNVVMFGVGIILVAVLLSLVGCSDDKDDDQTVEAGAAYGDTSQTEPGSSDDQTTTVPDDAAPAYGSGECPPADGVDT